MDKTSNIGSNLYGEIAIIDRKKINLTGIKKLISFNPEEFLIESNLGVLLLKGSSLEIVKLDTLDGKLAIKGRVDSLSYIDGNKKSESIFARLFK